MDSDVYVRKLGSEMLNILAGLSEYTWEITKPHELPSVTQDALLLLVEQCLLERKIYYEQRAEEYTFDEEWQCLGWVEKTYPYYIQIDSDYEEKSLHSELQKQLELAIDALGDRGRNPQIMFLKWTAYRLNTSRIGIEQLTRLVNSIERENDSSFIEMIKEWISVRDESWEIGTRHVFPIYRDNFFNVEVHNAISDLHSIDASNSRLSKIFTTQNSIESLIERVQSFGLASNSDVEKGSNRKLRTHRDGKANSDKPDKTPDKNKIPEPRSPQVAELITRLKTGLQKGKKQIDIAREVIPILT